MNLYDCRILLVDDEPALREMVKNLLMKEGYQNIDTACSCQSAIAACKQKQHELILLDVMLPDGDGFWVYEQIGNETPVIFLSARDEDQDRLYGLGLGADDYITKPFLPEELLLRMRAVLKRTYKVEEKSNATEQIGDVLINWEAGTIVTQEEEYSLTAKEFVLLKKLCENKGKILSMNVLCDTLWPDGSYGYENSLMVHVRRLREKIEPDPSKPIHLCTVRGLGYKLV